MGSLQIPNKSAATGTRTRTGSDVLPQSGMCVVCLDGCPGYCEIGLSAMRGPETIYLYHLGKVHPVEQKIILSTIHTLTLLELFPVITRESTNSL